VLFITRVRGHADANQLGPQDFSRLRMPLASPEAPLMG
jgi:hypothetical protein